MKILNGSVEPRTHSKAWDSTLKLLVHTKPSAFVNWLFPDADFVAERPTAIETYIREVDVLHEVSFHGHPMLLHIEFQTYNDVTMPNRLLVYNVLLTDVYKLPVLSCVVYLLPNGRVQPSPLRRSIPEGGDIHVFHFESIEIGQLTAEQMIQLGDETLFALVPLTRNGTERSVMESLFEELEQRRVQPGASEHISEIEVIALTLASFALEQKKKIPDLEWLKRRFQEMLEAFEDAYIYKDMRQRVLEMGIQQGEQIGLEKGQEQGRVVASRHSLQLFVQSRFPALAALAQEKVAQIDDLERLDVMIVGIGSAQTQEEAQAVLQGSSTL